MKQNLSIAVCDDEAMETEKIKALLAEKEYPFTYTLDIFTDSQKLPEQLRARRYDLVFLDIEMPHVDGFSLASAIRSFSPATEIVFVSNHEHLVYQSLGFKPFYFVRKAFLEEEIPWCLNQFWKQIEQEGVFCEFPTATDVRKINVYHIVYLESLDHSLYVHHTSGVFSCRGQISDREDELRPYGFLRIHRSYLINCRFIQQIGSATILMADGKELPCSRRRKKEIQKAVQEFTEEGK